MITKAGRTFRSLYENPDEVPDNFILQIAFTHKVSILLTTDGRVFSWGDKENACIGIGGDGDDHEAVKEELNASASQSGSNLGGDEVEETDLIYEVQLTNKKGRALITQIATGRNHVLALDTLGNVYSWGIDKFGQLGHGWDESTFSAAQAAKTSIVVRRPKIVGGPLVSHEAAQIFAGDKQSFAVTKHGRIFCWGKNEHSMLGFKENNEIFSTPKELILGAMGGNAHGSFSHASANIYSNQADQAKNY